MSEGVSSVATPIPPSKRNLELSGLCPETAKRAKKEDKGKQTSIDSRALRKAQTGRVFPAAWWELDGIVDDYKADMDEDEIKQELEQCIDDMDEYQLRQMFKMCFYLQNNGE